MEQLPAAATGARPVTPRRPVRVRAVRVRGARAAAYTQLIEQFATLPSADREAAIAHYEQNHPAGDFQIEQLQARHEELAALEAGVLDDQITPTPINDEVDEATADVVDSDAQAIARAT